MGIDIQMCLSLDYLLVSLSAAMFAAPFLQELEKLPTVVGMMHFICLVRHWTKMRSYVRALINA